MVYIYIYVCIYIYIAESHDIDIDLNMSNITLVGCGIPNIQEKLCSFVSVTNSVLLVFLSRDNIVPFLLSALAKLVECRRELEDLGLIGITTRTILHTLDWSISLLLSISANQTYDYVYIYIYTYCVYIYIYV